VEWYRKAAEQNDNDAQYNLGVCYAKGQGIAKDYIEGYKWLFLAAAQGDENKKKALSLLESRMSQEQIAEEKKLARDFKPRQSSLSLSSPFHPTAH
jgi:localization factor PodJL